MTLNKDQKKQAAAVVLACLAATLIVYNIFFSSSAPPPTKKTSSRKTIPGLSTTILNTGSENSPAESRGEILMVSQPLDMDGLGGSVSPVMGRNIFIYPPPPLIPTPRPSKEVVVVPPTPPPPPPITLGGSNPNSVTAKTKGFEMTIYGAKFPADAQVSINGSPLPTTFLNDTQLKIAMPQTAIANPGNLRIEVRGASDPIKMFSNPLNFTVNPAPIPEFIYTGIIVKNGVSTAVIRDKTETEFQNVRKGQKIGPWQITNINPNVIEILDTRIGVSHSIQFTGDSGG
jgi:hypothetical protein